MNSKGPECVLVVDDDEGVRETLREVVEMAGCSAITAANGAEALQILLGERRPCLVILDLLMPVMTGNELLDAIRRHPSLAKLQVVVSTSAPGRAPPGVPVLTKPIDLAAVWGWMQRTCGCAASLPATN
jgi:two-component system, OmpR family, response regulator CpxR